MITRHDTPGMKHQVSFSLDMVPLDRRSAISAYSSGPTAGLCPCPLTRPTTLVHPLRVLATPETRRRLTEQRNFDVENVTGVELTGERGNSHTSLNAFLVQ